ncbi:alpha/beta hydrolase family protein [Gordonia shandongensis]|uniref:alpha/beta hydrolase family protein n=1 Tax=Gordonia shandongensis TaxID=376351 RepID=UPI001FE0D99E|nr:lipase family protein [Gordonia shandongensis]
MDNRSRRTRAATSAFRRILGTVLAAVVVTALTPGVAAARPVNAPGQIIGVFDRPDGWRGLDGGRAIDYWTQDGRGRPVPTSGALLVPPGPAPRGGWPVVVYNHGTSGFSAGCGGQSAPAAGENRYITRLVRKGYAVVATDYVGLGRFHTGPHPYLNTRSEATAAIDLLRAARSVEPELSNTWAVTGDSQGGQAALATAHRQRTYGPRTDFRGTVAIDPESDVEKIAGLLGPYIPRLPSLADGAYEYVLAILAGLRSTDPGARVDDYLTPLGEKVVHSVGTGECRPDVDTSIPLGALLTKPLGVGPLVPALNRYMQVPTSGYDRPILLVLNTLDTTVPSPLHAALVAQFAAGGVDFATSVANGSHTEMNARQWADFDRFFARVLKR